MPRSTKTLNDWGAHSLNPQSLTAFLRAVRPIRQASDIDENIANHYLRHP